jgi:copper(I)-binding protein
MPMPTPTKRILTLCLALVLAMTANGCGTPSDAPDKSAATASAPEQQPAAAPADGSGETPAALSAGSAGEIEVQEVRATLTPSMGAVYLTVVNHGAQSDRLLRVECSVAEAAEFHESREEKGMMTMVPHPDGFEVPAGGTLALQPGGKHVMLVAPRMFAASGGTIPLTLHFARAGSVEAQAKVAALGEGAERP